MKNKVIIIEGAQGVGKGTITNILREQMPYTNLLRLSGTSDKTAEGKNKVYNIRVAELDMIRNSRFCDINFILDRSYLSEVVYCKIGYKDYTFEEESLNLNNFLNELTNYYDVYVIVLTATPEEFEKRLKRDKPEFLNLKFNPDSSIRQQEAYLEEMRNLKRTYPAINCYEVPTSGRDPYDIAYDILSVVRRD